MPLPFLDFTLIWALPCSTVYPLASISLISFLMSLCIGNCTFWTGSPARLTFLSLSRYPLVKVQSGAVTDNLPSLSQLKP